MGLGCGVVAICTCQMPSATLQVPSRTTSPFFCTVMLVALNVAVQPSSQIFPIYISAPYWRWGEMYSIFALVNNKVIMLSSSLWVAYMRLPSVRITRSH